MKTHAELFPQQGCAKGFLSTLVRCLEHPMGLANLLMCSPI